MRPPIDKPALERYIEDYVFELGYELVDFSMDPMGRAQLISIYLDRILGGITIKDCQVVNDKLRLVLEADRLAGQDFRLIVSSPGLDRVIKKATDFQRFQGRKIKVWFPPSEGAKKGRTVEGVLDNYGDDGTILLRVETGEALEFRYSDVKLVRLIPELDFTPGKVGKTDEATP
ncbi:MAG: ribosome maturation factor RimP [bacterium]